MTPKKTDIEILYGKIKDFICREDISVPLNFLIEKLPPEAELYIVGGSLRNLLILQIHGASPPTGDIDIVIGGLGAEFSLENILKDETFKDANFGGLKWYPENSPFSFDLSLLENFLPLKKHRLAPTMENLVSTIDFSINTLVFDVKKGVLHENGAVKAVREKTIGIHSEKVYDYVFLAYRLLLIRHKIGFYPSEKAFEFLRCAIGLDDAIWIKNTLEANHGKSFSKEILADYDRICSYNNYEDYKRSEKPPEYLANPENKDQEKAKK